MVSTANVKNVVRGRTFVIFVASGLSTVGGAIAGYKYAMRILDEKYAHIADEEIRQAREHYSEKFKAGEYVDPSALAEKYTEVKEDLEEAEEEAELGENMIKVAAKIIEDSEYTHYNRPQDIPDKVQTVAETVKSNVLVEHSGVIGDDGDAVYDVEAESAKKRAKKPYIVEYDEFYPNEEERNISTLVWYEIDGIMVDSEDRALTQGEFDRLVGSEQNLRFGYGSKDPNTVLIYNDKLDAALEIVRNPGSYANLKLGLNENFLEHADKRKIPIRRMRQEPDR
jgi:hypothetical protein